MESGKQLLGDQQPLGDVPTGYQSEKDKSDDDFDLNEQRKLSGGQQPLGYGSTDYPSREDSADTDSEADKVSESEGEEEEKIHPENSFKQIIAKIDNAIAILENQIKAMKNAAYCGSELCCAECKSASGCCCSIYLMSFACGFGGFNPIAGLLTCLPAYLLGARAYTEAQKAAVSLNSNAYWEDVLKKLPFNTKFSESQQYLKVLEALTEAGLEVDSLIDTNVIFLKQLAQLKGRRLELINSEGRLLGKKSFFNEWVKSDAKGNQSTIRQLCNRLNKIVDQKTAAYQAGDIQSANAFYLDEQQLAINYHVHLAGEAEERLKEADGYTDLDYQKTIREKYANQKREAISKLKAIEEYVDLNLTTVREDFTIARLKGMKQLVRYELWRLSKNPKRICVPGCLFPKPTAKQETAPPPAPSHPSPHPSPSVKDVGTV